MKINFNVTGNDRKALVKFIGEALEEKPKYLGVPSCAYQIGDFTVSKDGCLEFNDGIDATNLIAAIKEAGYAVGEDDVDEPVAADSSAEVSEDTLTIEMPRSFYSDTALDNLKRIVESKATLIKESLGTEELPIRVTDDKVSFPWFKEPNPDSVAAYTAFVTKLSEMAKEAKRVTATDHEVDNPKYAMRCFLLRLGFIGSEYKSARKILLKNLSGNSSWKNGKKEAESDEATE